MAIPWVTVTLTFFLFLSLSTPLSEARTDFVGSACLKVSQTQFVGSVNEVLTAIQQVASILSRFNSHSSYFRLATAVVDLLDLSSDVLSSDVLSRALSATQNPNGKHNSTGNLSSDLRTWLSAALAHPETCMEGFEGTNGIVKGLVSAGVGQVISLLEHILAQVLPILDHYGPTKGKFPSWVKPNDRKLLQASGVAPDAVVAADGSGNYAKIMDAVLAAPDYSMKRFVIYVKKGVYVENVEIKKKKWNIMIVGDGIDATVISGNLRFVDGWTTFRSPPFGQMAMSKAEMARRFAEKMKRQSAEKAGLGEKLTAEGVGDSGVAQFSSTRPKSTQPIPLAVENVEGTAHQTRKRPRAEGDHSVLQLSDTEDEVLADVMSRKNSNMSLWHEHFPHEMLLRKSLYPADASRYESVEMMDVMKELSTLTTRLGALLVVAHDKNDAIVAKGDDTEKKLAASEQLVVDLRQEMRVLADEKADLEKLKVDFAKEKADWENEMLTLTNEVNRYKGKSERLESENKRLEKAVEMMAHWLTDENVEAVKAEAVDKFTEGFDACQSQMLLLDPDLDVTQIGYFKEVKDGMLVDPLD